jgi:hypothetical protein
MTALQQLWDFCLDELSADHILLKVSMLGETTLTLFSTYLLAFAPRLTLLKSLSETGPFQEEATFKPLLC